MTSYISSDLGMEVKPIPSDVHKFSVESIKNKTDAVESEDGGQGELFDEKAPNKHGVKFENSAEKIKNKLVEESDDDTELVLFEEMEVRSLMDHGLGVFSKTDLDVEAVLEMPSQF